MGGQKFLRGSCSIGGHSTGLLWAIAARVGWVSCHCLRHDPSCHDRLQASERQEVDLAGLEITRLLQQRGYCGALRGTISHRCRSSLFFLLDLSVSHPKAGLRGTVRSKWRQLGDWNWSLKSFHTDAIDTVGFDRSVRIPFKAG